MQIIPASYRYKLQYKEGLDWTDYDALFTMEGAMLVFDGIPEVMVKNYEWRIGIYKTTLIGERNLPWKDE